MYLTRKLKRMKYLIIALCTITLSLTSCDALNDIYGGTGGMGRPTDQETNFALKDALVQGITNGSLRAGKQDGYLGNSLIRIPWPEDAQKIKNVLLTLGLDNEVQKVETSINRAAEKAALESVDIFKDAIRQLTFQDVVAIVTGEKDAATNFLKRATYNALVSRFSPVIEDALGDVNATKYWADAIGVYNDLPTTFKKVNPDLTGFVTEKAIDGLFTLVAEEEAKIRKDPIARGTEVMRKVFGYYANNRY